MTSSTIKSISIIAATTLGAALLGILGAYLALPAVVPNVAEADESAEQTASARDSIMTPASGPRPDSAAGGMGAGSPDSLAEARGASGSSASTSSGEASEAERMQALQDSIDGLNRRVQEMEKEADSLRTKLADMSAEQAKVDKLSDALMNMRGRNLSDLLQDVEMDVLRQLYQETSGRARTQLLQSMAPAQAAQFVNQVVEDSTGASSTESESTPE